VSGSPRSRYIQLGAGEGSYRTSRGPSVNEAPLSKQERRKFRRSVVRMPVQAVRRSVSETDPRRLVGLHVLDVSRGGVGAVCQDSLERTEPLLLFFPPMGAGRGSDVSGRVVHCTRSSDRFAVGIVFDNPWPNPEEPRSMAAEFQPNADLKRPPDYL
jgi:hypothetical protein